MESQISTGTHNGPGIDLPEQGLHLRRRQGDDWHGVLDTSMGPVGVDIHRSHVAGGDEVGGDEVVLPVPEQFVALKVDGEALTGDIRSGFGVIPFRGTRHRE